MKHFLIIKNAEKDKDFSFTNQVRDYLMQKGATVQILTRGLEQMREIPIFEESFDCVMVLGGDGSILRTVRALFHRNIPIVGVNLGNLGFLTQTEPEDVTVLLDRLLLDDVQIEERMMLSGVMYHNGEKVYEDTALNDIVVGRTGLSRIIRLKLFVNHELLNVYDADGVVVSTPTGSTAYNLSAGGPVVCPKTNLIIVTPISPHSLSARSVILSEQDELTIEVEHVRAMREEAVATFDGQTGKSMLPADRIVIAKSEQSAKLIRVKNMSFYDILRSKMK